MTPRKKSAEAVKAEGNQLPDYELVFIVNPEVAEETLQTAIGGVTQFITSKGGTVAAEERWGKRKLAYPIKRFREGSYVLTQFKLAPKWCQELETNLRISENILRHLLVKLGS